MVIFSTISKDLKDVTEGGNKFQDLAGECIRLSHLVEKKIDCISTQSQSIIM